MAGDDKVGGKCVNSVAWMEVARGRVAWEEVAGRGKKKESRDSLIP